MKDIWEFILCTIFAKSCFVFLSLKEGDLKAPIKQNQVGWNVAQW